MVKAGIIDPAKVVRLALQGAASVAGLLITTEAMVADKPQSGAPACLAVAWAGWVEWITSHPSGWWAREDGLAAPAIAAASDR